MKLEFISMPEGRDAMNEPAPAPLALRIDDIGACTKRYEVYSDWYWRWGPLRFNGNWLFLKYVPPFQKWGIYREMREDEWVRVFEVLRSHDARLTVAITAAWADGERRVTPFPQRFPAEASMLREGLDAGVIEIANHGLTHCIVENNAFKPRWWASNREHHREFWAWVPRAIQEDHIERSQDILQSYFQCDVVTFVPPGGVMSVDTEEIARRHGLRYFSGVTSITIHDGMIPETMVLAFHDRDLVLNGLAWLTEQLDRHPGRRFCAVRDLVA